MTFSRQEDSLTKGRANQRARTRGALVEAADALIQQGRAPSMQEAADRALVSLATAYRYFRTADELWAEAATFASSRVFDSDALQADLAAAGDVEARLDALVRRMQFALIDNHVYARQTTKASIDRWFAAQGSDEPNRPIRPSQRVRWLAMTLEPLREEYEDYVVDSIEEALAFVIGVESVITLLDVLRLSPEAAKERTLVTARWILHAGLAEASTKPPRKKKA